MKKYMKMAGRAVSIREPHSRRLVIPLKEFDQIVAEMFGQGRRKRLTKPFVEAAREMANA